MYEKEKVQTKRAMTTHVGPAGQIAAYEDPILQHLNHAISLINEALSQTTSDQPIPKGEEGKKSS